MPIGVVLFSGTGLERSAPTFAHARDGKALVPMLRTSGVTRVSDARIIHEGKIVTAAGVSAGIDLGLWLAGEMGGEVQAKAIRLAIEYDPQPPLDSGHTSKASAAARALATTQLTRQTFAERQLGHSVQLLWGTALDRVRARRR